MHVAIVVTINEPEDLANPIVAIIYGLLNVKIEKLDKEIKSS